MRKIAITLSACCFSLFGYSQIDSTEVQPTEPTREVIGNSKSNVDANKVQIERGTEFESGGAYTDTTRIQFGKKQITVVTKGDDDVKVSVDRDRSKKGNKSSLSWWQGIDIGMNTLTTSDFNFNIEGEFSFLNPRMLQSRYISGNVLFWKGRLVGDYLGIATGGSIQIYNFKYNGDFIFNLGDSLYATPSGDINVTKNKLRAEYLGIPLLLEVNTSLDPRKSFHITAGVIGKMRLGNMYGGRWNQNGNFNKGKIKGDLGLNRWAADAILRVGYGNFTLFAQAALLPLFDNDNAPDIRTFSAGFALTFND